MIPLAVCVTHDVFFFFLQNTFTQACAPKHAYSAVGKPVHVSDMHQCMLVSACTCTCYITLDWHTTCRWWSYRLSSPCVLLTLPGTPPPRSALGAKADLYGSNPKGRLTARNALWLTFLFFFFHVHAFPRLHWAPKRVCHKAQRVRLFTRSNKVHCERALKGKSCHCLRCSGLVFSSENTERWPVGSVLFAGLNRLTWRQLFLLCLLLSGLLCKCCGGLWKS